MKNKLMIILLCGLSLTSCSMFSPVAADDTSTYMLTTIPSSIPKHPRRAGTLLVMTPDTQPAYNTNRMAYTTKKYQLSYFGRNQWAETPAQMLLPLIVQSLQNTEYYRAVAAAPYMGKAEYLLTTQIIKLQQNFLHKPPTIEFYLRAQLTHLTNNQVVATKQFAMVTPLHENTPYGGVLAANEATGKLLASLTNFCVENT